MSESSNRPGDGSGRDVAEQRPSLAPEDARLSFAPDRNDIPVRCPVCGESILEDPPQRRGGNRAAPSLLEYLLEFTGAVGTGPGGVSAGSAADDSVLVCHRCRTPHHRACWYYNAGCALYGCRSVTAAAPSAFDTQPGDTVGTTEEVTLYDYTGSAMPAGKYLFAAAVAAVTAVLLQPGLLNPLILLGCVYFLILVLRRFIFYHRLFFHEDGSVSRQPVLLGSPIGRARRHWLEPGSVSAVVLHRGKRFGILSERIELKLTAGGSRVIYDTTAPAPWFSLPDEALTERAWAMAKRLGVPLEESSSGLDHVHSLDERPRHATGLSPASRPSPHSKTRPPVEGSVPGRGARKKDGRETSCVISKNGRRPEHCTSKPAAGKLAAPVQAPSPDEGPFQFTARRPPPEGLESLAWWTQVLFLSSLPLAWAFPGSPFNLLFALSFILTVIVCACLVLSGVPGKIELRFVPGRDEILYRPLLFGIPRGDFRPWSVQPGEIVEVIFGDYYWYGTTANAIYLALASGRKILVCRYDPRYDYLSSLSGPVLSRPEALALAERIARACRCTVRLVRDVPWSFSAETLDSGPAALMKLRRVEEELAEKQRELEELEEPDGDS